MTGAARRDIPIAVVILAALFLVGCTLAAMLSGLWALTAAPLGFLLGYLLAKGDLCSASAFGEVLIMKDGRKLGGLWVAVVAAMIVFAAMEQVGLIAVGPRPLYWLSYLAGGLIFGTGMVLAGGCVSGTLYKCGAGHQNAIFALLAMPFGIMMVDFGLLSGMDRALREHVLHGPGGGPVTFSSLTGLSFASLALAFAGLTAGAWFLLARRRRAKATTKRNVTRRHVPLGTRFWKRPWKPVTAGLLLGVLAAPVWLSSMASGRDFPICVTYGVEEAPLLVTERSPTVIWDQADRAAADLNESFAAGGSPSKRIYVWLLLFVLGMVPGSYAASRLMGKSGLKKRPPSELIVAVAGGLLVGIGAGLGRGCILGNGVMGTAMMSVGMLLFAVAACLANWVTSWLYVLGGPFR